MEKQVFLAIFVFALVKFQGINGSAITTTTPIPGCSCDTMLDPNGNRKVLNYQLSLNNRTVFF